MNNALPLPPLGLGTVKIGRNRGVKYPDSFELPSDAELERLLEGALDLGVYLIDTAPAYGTSEARLHDFVVRHRSELVLCSKAGEDFDEKGSRFDYRPENIIASCERSLRRMGTDYLDLFLLHSDGNDLTILNDTGAVDALQQLKEQGKAKAIGISAKTEAGIRRSTEILDLIMAPYSMAQPELAPALQSAHDAGLKVLIIKALASGHTVDAELALEHAFDQPFVDCVVLGTLRLPHLEQAWRIAKGK